MKKLKLLSRIVHMHSKGTQLLFIAKRKLKNQREADKMAGFVLACRLIIGAWYQIYGEEIAGKEPQRAKEAVNALLN